MIQAYKAGEDQVIATEAADVWALGVRLLLSFSSAPAHQCFGLLSSAPILAMRSALPRSGLSPWKSIATRPMGLPPLGWLISVG